MSAVNVQQPLLTSLEYDKHPWTEITSNSRCPISHHAAVTNTNDGQKCPSINHASITDSSDEDVITSNNKNKVDYLALAEQVDQWLAAEESSA
jgi:hypothetical protein